MAVEHNADNHTALYLAVENYQRGHHLLCAKSRELLSADLVSWVKEYQQRSSTQIWALLQNTLYGVAIRWVDTLGHEFSNSPSHRTRRDVAAALAEDSFVAILEALPKVQLDKVRNLYAYFHTIAHNQFKNDFKQFKNRYREHTPLSAAFPDDSSHEEVADPEWLSFDEEILSGLAHPRQREEVQKFWDTRLRPIDQQIMRRLLEAPNLPRAELAKEFGPAWTEAMVNERIHRVYKATRDYLQSRGCVDLTNVGAIQLSPEDEVLLRDPYLMKKIQPFWSCSLKPKDQKIMQICLGEVRLRTYHEVAVELGPYVTVESVRSRVQQIMRETRDYLQGIGDLPP